jgi:hypothetical protein
MWFMCRAAPALLTPFQLFSLSSFFGFGRRRERERLVPRDKKRAGLGEKEAKVDPVEVGKNLRRKKENKRGRA